MIPRSRLNSNSVLAALLFRYSSNLVFQLAGFIVAMVVSKLLGPELLGYYALLNIIKNYLSYTNLGSTNGLTWSLGMSLGAGKQEEADSTIKTAFTFHFILPLFFAISIVVVSAFIELQYPLNWVVPFAGIIGFIDLYGVNLSRIFGAMELHKYLARIKIIKSFLTIIVVIPLVYFFSIEGRIFAALLLSLFLTVVYHVKIKNKLAFHWDKEKFKELIRVGFPIMMAGFLHANFFLADRLIITGFLTIEDLGMYAFGFYLVNVVKMIKGTVANVVYQRQNRVFGKFGPQDTSQLFRITKSTSYFVTDLTGIVSGISLIVFTYAVLIFMPEYSDALNITYIVVFSQAIGSINVLNTVRKNYLFLGILSFSLLVNVSLGILLVTTYGLIGVAYATFFSFMLLNSIINFVNLRFFKKSIKVSIIVTLRIVLVPATVFIVAFFIKEGILYTYVGESLFHEFFKMLAFEILFLILSIPLFFMIKNHLRALNNIEID